MKKILAILLAALLAVCLIGCNKDKADENANNGANNAVIEEAIFNDFKYAVNEAGDYEITGYLYGGKDLQDVSVPAEINGRPVVGIDSAAFKAAKNIKSVTIPSSVTYIGDLAFYDCDYLTEITIPASVKTVGMGAFMDCAQLAKATLATGTVEIGAYAFKDCVALNTLTLPDGLVIIGDAAFSGCRELTAVTIPATVKAIGDTAFCDCTKLAAVTYLATQSAADVDILAKMNAALAGAETAPTTLAQAVEVLRKAGLYVGGVTADGFTYVWEEATNTVIGSVSEADDTLLASINTALAAADPKPAQLDGVLATLSAANIQINTLNQSAIVSKYVWNAQTNTVSTVSYGAILFNDCAEALTI
ncbi:MAG: leucine-rich repeat domain-containing protein, partial [Clostridia bacterium]|nr:leucine-rich repeat domain-containing protein [Clostridia bacterium]